MVELLPQQFLCRCSDIFRYHLQQSVYTDVYFKLSNDSNRSCLNNDTVWITPACRSNLSECVPLLVQFSFDTAIQLGYFLNMPLAIVMVNGDLDPGLARYNQAIRAGNFLFHTWYPDSGLTDAAGNLPVMLNLPRQNRREQLLGVYRTGKQDVKPRVYCWNQLRAVDRNIPYFVSKLNFENEDMDAFMAASSRLMQGGLDSVAAARRLACEWVRTSEATWSQWIPAICPPAAYSDPAMTACLPCPAGSYCPDGSAAPLPCPAGSYCPANSSAPAPCRDGGGPGLTTRGPGAAAAADCGVCEAGFVALAGPGGPGCVAFSVLLPAVLLPAVALTLALAWCGRPQGLTAEDRSLLDRVAALREALLVRRRDGFVVGPERAAGRGLGGAAPTAIQVPHIPHMPSPTPLPRRTRARAAHEGARPSVRTRPGARGPARQASLPGNMGWAPDGPPPT